MHRRAAGLTLFAGIEGSRRDFNEPFNERDRSRVSFHLGAKRSLSPRISATMEGAIRRSRSRNEPDLGKDLSNWDWRLVPAVEVRQPSGLSALSLSATLCRRNYTSTIPDDWNHRGRNDWIGTVRLQGRRNLSPEFAIGVSYARNWRTARLDSGQAIDYDEAGSFSENVFSLGLNWQRRFDP